MTTQPRPIETTTCSPCYGTGRALISCGPDDHACELCRGLGVIDLRVLERLNREAQDRLRRRAA